MDYTYSTKQANVIRRAWEEGKLELSEEGMERIYRFANGGIPGFSISAFDAVADMRGAVKAVFNRDYETAQMRIRAFMYDTEGFAIA